MNAYKELKSRHQQEVNDFPKFFAFNNEQFEKGMKSLGLNPDDIKEIYSLEGTGGYYRRSDNDRLKEMFARHEKERQEAVETDKTGNGYLYDMFLCELANHEYTYTMELEDTLDALGLTYEDIEKSKPMKRALNKAIKKLMKADCFN